MTYNLGAVCFGSLIIAVVEAIQAVGLLLQKLADKTQNKCLSYILGLGECLLGCIKCCIEYITSYVYVYTGVYGYGFVHAGTKVVELLGHNFTTVAANDSLVGGLCFVGTLFVTAASSALSIYLVQETDYANSLEDAEWNLGVAGAAIGFAVAQVCFGLIVAANRTVLVLWLEKPEDLRVVHEDYYHELYEIWHDELNFDVKEQKEGVVVTTE